MLAPFHLHRQCSRPGAFSTSFTIIFTSEELKGETIGAEIPMNPLLSVVMLSLGGSHSQKMVRDYAPMACQSTFNWGRRFECHCQREQENEAVKKKGMGNEFLFL